MDKEETEIVQIKYRDTKAFKESLKVQADKEVRSLQSLIANALRLYMASKGEGKRY